MQADCISAPASRQPAPVRGGWKWIFAATDAERERCGLVGSVVIRVVNQRGPLSQTYDVVEVRELLFNEDGAFTDFGPRVTGWRFCLRGGAAVYTVDLSFGGGVAICECADAMRRRGGEHCKHTRATVAMREWLAARADAARAMEEEPEMEAVA